MSSLKSKHGSGFDGDAFDRALIGPSQDAEEAVFAPLRPPAVLDDPVGLAGGSLHAVPDDNDNVLSHDERVEAIRDAALPVDAAAIAHQIIGDGHRDSERAAIHQGQPHQRLITPARND